MVDLTVDVMVDLMVDFMLDLMVDLTVFEISILLSIYNLEFKMSIKQDCPRTVRPLILLYIHVVVYSNTIQSFEINT